MWIFPLAAALTAAAFTGMLLARSARRPRPAEAMWAVALAMYAAASLAMFLGTLTAWSPVEFRVYWLLGGTLNVPYLAQGEIYLLAPRAVANALLVVLIFGTAFAIAKIRSAPVHVGSLSDSLPLG